MPADTERLRQIAHLLYQDAEIEHLGTGGFASTFKVSTASDVYAVKIIDPHRSETLRAHREIAALQRVQHPGIVTYRKIGATELDGTTFTFIEMDYIDGVPLSRSLFSGQLFQLRTAANLLRQLVEAAGALWSEHTAHRDLSPNNILLTADDTAVIVDLGMARHVDDETATVLPTPGTPGWMSPEQVGSDPKRGDWRSDQFVLGLIGWTLATGTRPFSAQSLHELWASPASTRVRRADEVNPAVPSHLSDVLFKMTERQPYRRYLTLDSLLADIDAAIAVLRQPEIKTVGELQFFVTVGQIKNVYLADEEFSKHLDASGFILDAAQCEARCKDLTTAAHNGSGIAAIDPISYWDRSPIEARSSSYRNLPYGQAPRLVGFADDYARKTYCSAILNHQLNHNTDAIITPYFLAEGSELSWVEETIACAKTCSDELKERGITKPLWYAVAITPGMLRRDSLDELLTALTADSFPRMYLLIHTEQDAFAPLGNEEILFGLREVLSICREIGTPVVVGRRDVSGLLALALGATGWSTGISANLQNLPRNLEEPEDGGGQPSDWYYVPELLNSVTMLTRGRLAGKGLLPPPSTPYAETLFSSGSPIAQISTTEQRILLRQHNIFAMRQQVKRLNEVEPAARVSTIRTWIHNAQQLYNELPGIIATSERGEFLSAWTKVL